MSQGSDIKLKTFIFLLILLSFSFSYSQDLFTQANPNNISKEEVVASVDTINITAEEFFYNYEFGPAFSKREKNSKEVYLNYIINEKLIALEGYKEDLLEQDYEKGILNDFQSDLAAEELFREEILPKVKIGENEINKIIEKKLIEYEIRWLYSPDEPSVEYYLRQLKYGVSFDTLFNTQINDSVFRDDRQMKSSLYDIYMKNPLFAQILDTLKAGITSAPLHTDDGWYIIKIDNIWRNLITTETEQTKLRLESIDALKTGKMESLSDEYVKNLFDEEKPVIKRDAFNILRSYLGKFVLSPENYSGWGMDIKLDSALSHLGLKRGDRYPGITLVAGVNYNFSLDDFIVWYRDREEYIKFSTKNLPEFSKSLENLIWTMIRDKMLGEIAAGKGYNNSPWVKKQMEWWKDKVAYSAYKDELAKSIKLSSDEIKLVKDKKKSESDILGEKLSAIILHKVLELKSKYKISINKDVLGKLIVSSENDKNDIDVYFVKRDNLIPRLLYPSIDYEWISWE